MTKSTNLANDVAALLRARNPLLWVVTREEARVEQHLVEAAVAAGYLPRTWDVAQGVADMAGERQPNIRGTDPGDVLSTIRDRAEKSKERGAWILRDMPAWLTGFAGVTTLRQLRNLARMLPGVERDSAQAVIILTPSSDVPPELSGHATVIDWPLPDRGEVAEILDAAIEALPEDVQAAAAPNGTREEAIDAAVGLSGEEAAACYARSLVQLRRVDPALVAQEKKRVVARERVLEWFDPLPGGLDAVGGLDVLKSWLTSRSMAYSPEARAYGLPAPRGTLLVGISGCGKSLSAKAVATAWKVPLLRLDLGALKSKFVGESEANLRKSFSVIETIGRCVVWLDELEKALQGATSGSADGGVAADALGAILNWMQERAGEAFVIATANDVTSLPPELLRKGRFDEMWFVDLPTQSEREAILAATLRSFGRGDLDISLADVAEKCAGFTGSEIAALVPDALYAAFADGGRQVNTKDLVRAAGSVTPLSETAKEKIDALRAWAKGRARRATSDDAASGQRKSSARKLDI